MSQQDSSSPDPAPLNPFLQAIIYAAVYITMPFHESAKYLRKHVYDAKGGGFALFLGVFASLGGGIGAGYYLGWQIQCQTSLWLLGGVASALITFFYAWPGLYLLIFRKSIEWSKKLWQKVPGSRDSIRKTARNGWFTELLSFLGYVAAVVLAAAVFWKTMGAVQGYLEWGWFGYIPGAIGGAIICLFVGAFACSVVYFLDMFIIAVATGFALIYFTAPWTRSCVESFGLGGPYVKGAFTIQGVLWMAYVFPLAHIVLGNCFYFLKDLFKNLEKLLDSVYDEPKGGYRELSNQVLSIGLAITAGYFSVSLWGMLGASYVFCLVLSVLAGFLAYLFFGKFFESTGCAPVGFASAVGAAYLAFQYWGEQALWFGLFGQIVAAIVAALLTGFVLFPLLYAGVRKVADPLFTSWLREPLLKLYESLSKEIFHAYSNTYDDKTEYRDLFLHLVNIASAIGIGIGAYCLGVGLSFALYLTVLLILASVGLSYLLIGQLLLKSKNYLVGVLVGLTGGVFGGAFVYASQDYGLLVAIPAGLIVASVVFGVFFPVAYVLLRAFANLVSVRSWLKPALEGIYQFFWTRFLVLWNRFVETYRKVRASFQPAIDSFMKTYRDTLASIRQNFNKPE